MGPEGPRSSSQVNGNGNETCVHAALVFGTETTTCAISFSSLKRTAMHQEDAHVSMYLRTSSSEKAHLKRQQHRIHMGSIRHGFCSLPRLPQMFLHTSWRPGIVWGSHQIP